MHPIMTCSNCQKVLFGRAFKKVDAATCDVACGDCGAIYRMSITTLHEGKSQNLAERRARLGYTYDDEHNRIALPNVPGQTTTEK